jgi:DUF971 family protein
MFPEEIRLAKDHTSSEIRWRGGFTRHLGTSLRRVNCRLASAIRELPDLAASSDPDAIRVEPIGAYAVNFAFLHGQQHGINSRPLLRSLGE